MLTDPWIVSAAETSKTVKYAQTINSKDCIAAMMNVLNVDQSDAST